MQEIANMLLMWTIKFWDSIVRTAFDVIKMDIKETEMWNTINYLAGPEGKITGVAVILLTILILIGWCAESTDVKRDFSMDSIFRLFIRIVLAEFVVVNNLNIFVWVYDIASGIADFVSVTEVGKIFSNEGFVEIMNLDGFFIPLLMFFLSIIFFFIVVGSGFMLLYEAYLRIIKTCLMIPLGALTWATVGSGTQVISNVGISYFKYAIATMLEMFMMIFTIKITNVFFNGGVQIFGSLDGASDYIIALAYMSIAAFQAVATVSLVKEGRNVLHRIFN